MKKYKRIKKKKTVASAYANSENRTVKYKKRRKAKKRRRLISLLILTLLVFCGIMIFTPVFNISKIEVKGNLKVSGDEIIQTGRIFKGDNIWLFGKNRAEKLIGGIPYVDTVTVSRIIPNKIKIAVKESKPYGYLKTGKKRYVLADRDGKILEQVTTPSKNLKKIEISKTASTKAGEYFASDGTLAGKSYKLLLRQLKKYGYEKDTNAITIKGDDIRFKYNELLVVVGDTKQLDYKFAFLKTFLSERGDDVEGCFDISAPDVGGYYSENFDKPEPVPLKNENIKDGGNKDDEEIPNEDAPE